MKQRLFVKERPLQDTILLVFAFLVLVLISYRLGQYSSVSSRVVDDGATGGVRSVRGVDDDDDDDDDDHDSFSLVPVIPTDPWIETVTWFPRLSVYHNFLTAGECDHLVSMLNDVLGDSGVLELKGGFVPLSMESTDEVLSALADRLGQWTHIPSDNAERFYFWKYTQGQYYPPHKDLLNPEKVGGAGQRTASVFVYLSTPTGGELSFPDAEPEPVNIQPRKGDAVLLWNLKPNGESDDEHITHTVFPVTEGIKYTLTRWIRQKKFIR